MKTLVYTLICGFLFAVVTPVVSAPSEYGTVFKKYKDVRHKAKVKKSKKVKDSYIPWVRSSY